MGSSTIFRCTKPVERGQAAHIRSMPFHKHEALLDEAIATAPEPIVPVLTATKALFYTACGMSDRALALLPTIETDRKTSDWAVDFSAVAMGSRDTVEFLAKLPQAEMAAYGVTPP